MATNLNFDRIVRDFVDGEYTDVSCPEFLDDDGNPTVVKFRTKLTVSDMLWLSERNIDSQPDLHRAELFYLLAVDDHGNPLISHDGDHDKHWSEKVDVAKLANIVMRGGIEEAVYGPMMSEERVELEKKSLMMGLRPQAATNRTQTAKLIHSLNPSGESH